jgi:hypothetical protein
MANGPSVREIAEGDPKKRLETAVVVRPTWPTPTAWLSMRPSHAECLPVLRHPGASIELSDAVGQAGDIGQLNPTWVEWLMGFPLGWTDCEPSETPSSPKSPNT